MDPTNKKFGLIIPKKKPVFPSRKSSNKLLQPRLAAFDNDDSSDGEGQKQVNSQIHKEALKQIAKKETKMQVQKALEQDAMVYEYDSIYDDMKSKSNQKKIPQNVQTADKQKKPKYISSLIKAADKRNRERQRIEERKIEKERLKEGDEFSDKPQFVTSAYRERMLEREKEEEEERRLAAIEDVMDVRKQKDMSGFYRHLLRQQVGEDFVPDSEERSANPTNDNEMMENEEDRDTDLSFSSSSESEEETREKRHSKKKKAAAAACHESSDSSGSPERATSNSRPQGDDRVPHRDRSRDFDERKRTHNSHRQNDYDRDSERRGDRDRRHDSNHDSRDRRRRNSDRDDRDRQWRESNHGDRDRQRREDRDRKNRNYRDEDDYCEPKHYREKSRKDRDHDNSPARKRGRETTDTKDEVEHHDTNREKRDTNRETNETAGRRPEKLEAKVPDIFTKRTTAESAQSARERYLARKRAGGAKRAPVVSDSD